MNWRVLLIGLALFAPLLYFLARGFENDPKALPEALTGQKAPPFSLESLEGHRISSQDFEGSPAVLNFWATWCVPCLQEHPYLIEQAGRYKPKGVVFLGILYGDTVEKARPQPVKY